jgi:hypothetical protein
LRFSASGPICAAGGFAVPSAATGNTAASPPCATAVTDGALEPPVVAMGGMDDAVDHLSIGT